MKRLDKDLSLYYFQNLMNFSHLASHFVTSRHGGVSSDSYKSLNMGMMQDDPVGNVMENRNRVANAVGLNANDFVYPVQIHGTHVPRVYEIDRGKGCHSISDAFADTDGFITNVPRLCLMTLAADCVPIVFLDPVEKAIGVAHAGWKGTVLKIPAVLIDNMKREFGTNPANLIVGIGPSGGPCCYEVGNDVVEEIAVHFNPSQVTVQRDGKTYFDMWKANRLTLTESGVKQENIEIAGICTITDNHTFFSARRGDNGRFAAGIFLV